MVDPASDLAPGPVPRGRRAGVIDIGSNSVRLVVFDGLLRQPLPIFNEKVQCGLGRAIDITGRLDEAGAEKALAALARFARLVAVMDIGHLGVLATAAVREAVDGPDFVARVAATSGLDVEVLSGADEARLAALGVISAMPTADGVMGDLGGGSLELVALEAGTAGPHATLPLGQLRLQEIASRDAGSLDSMIDDALATVPWLEKMRGRKLYAVGGGWRSLARVDMTRTDYPLRVVDGYALSRKRAAELTEAVVKLGAGTLGKLERVSQSRLEVLPVAARTLSRLLVLTAPDRVVFSAHGLREGWLYDQLDAVTRERDPLIAACRELASREGRFSEHGEELAAWTAPLFRDESAERRRLRLAACLLSDLAWRAHPDHRPGEALHHVLWAPFVGIEHPERAFLAVAVRARYTSRAKGSRAEPAAKLLSAEAAKRARMLGLALRLGHTITGGVPGVLGRFSLRLDRRRLILQVGRRDQALMGEAVRGRLDHLAKALDRGPVVEVSA
jgi:exopolyphosphatase/guanosine-5'-triphosphate,3'-diphosphate pyrophosphatase